MEKIFKVADSLTMKQRHHKSIIMIMPALLRLLYSTAIRTGEAISITNRDIDFAGHVITLNDTKNGCRRLAPLNSTMEAVLKQIYKNLQKVEHAFRDLKSDNISLRPVFHLKELQTKGHVLLCMFAYAIIKEMENRLYPFLKTTNLSQKRQLSFNDLTAELDNIKICELKIGNGVTLIQRSDLNPLQQEILDALNIDPEKIINQLWKKSKR